MGGLYDAATLHALLNMRPLYALADVGVPKACLMGQWLDTPRPRQGESEPEERNPSW